MPEGGEIDAVDEAGGDDNRPCAITTECALGDSLPNDHTPEIYFGEQIRSWRTCLKRYNWLNTFAVNSSTGLVSYNWNVPNFPCYRGFVDASEAMHATADGDPYNYTDTTLLNWVAPAYIGYRGGLRQKYAFHNVKQNSIGGIMELSRYSSEEAYSWQAFNKSGAGNLDTSSSNSFWYRKYLTHPWHGSTCTPIAQNPVLEAEIPYYNDRRFIPTRSLFENRGGRPCHKLDVDIYGLGGISRYVAAGDDFSLFFFLCTPVIYIYDIDPNPNVDGP